MLRAISQQSGGGGGGVTISTWANFPAASSVDAGTVRMASDYNNSEWVSDGTYWKPRGGRQRPVVMAAAVSSTGTASEVNAWAPTIPAGMLFPRCTVETGWSFTKTGTAGATTMRQRYNGASGTIVGHNLAAVSAGTGAVGLNRLAAGAASGGNIQLMQGNMSNTANCLGFINAATVSVTHAMGSAVTMNITMQCSSGADTLTLTNAYVEVCG